MTDIKLDEKAIKLIADLICGDIKGVRYRRGHDLVLFFNSLGFKDEYRKYFPSRCNYAIEKINELINQHKGIHKLIEKILDPLLFISDIDGDCDKEKKYILNYLNKIFKIYKHSIKLDERGYAQIIQNKLQQNVIDTDKNLTSLRPNISHEDIKRIWGNLKFKIFISHTNKNKEKASNLKNKLEIYGISSFVAHADIKVNQIWQDEIERALFSMDAFIALLTEDFHKSEWTDQEIGIAYARDVPRIAVRLGKDPYGFIGKFQALSNDWDSIHFDIVKLLIKHSRMIDAYLQAIENCPDFDTGNNFAKLLPDIDRLTTSQIWQLINAFNDNLQVRESFGFNGKKSSLYGEGLVHHLQRITSENYRLSKNGKSIIL